MLVEKFLQSALIPTGQGLFSLNNEGGAFSNTMAQGFVDAEQRLCVDKFDQETVFVKPVQFPDPVREFRGLLFQILRILIELFFWYARFSPASSKIIEQRLQ